MKSKDPQEIKPKHWYEMGLSDMPQKQPVIAWILRITVGTALGRRWLWRLPSQFTAQFKSRAQVGQQTVDQPVNAVNNIFKPQAAATAVLSFSPASGDFKIGDIFPLIFN